MMEMTIQINKRVLVILMVWLITIGELIYSQPKTDAQIQNIEFEQFGDSLIIRYDIANYKPNEQFVTKVNIFKKDGTRLNATSLSGDVGKIIHGGVGKKVVWLMSADIERLDEDVFLEVLAKKYDQVNIPTIMLLSAAYPGLGKYRVSGKKPYLAMGAAAYGSLITGIMCAISAKNTLKTYQSQVHANDTQSSQTFNKYQNQIRTANFMIATAAIIWVGNAFWTYLYLKKFLKERDQKLRSNFWLSLNYDFISNENLTFALKYQF